MVPAVRGSGTIAVLARCKDCGGEMRERVDKGAFSKAPLGRLWIYECDRCGRRVQFCSPTSPLEAAVKSLNIPEAVLRRASNVG